MFLNLRFTEESADSLIKSSRINTNAAVPQVILSTKRMLQFNGIKLSLRNSPRGNYRLKINGIQNSNYQLVVNAKKEYERLSRDSK